MNSIIKKNSMIFFFLQIDNKSIKIFSQNEFFWKKNVFNVRK